MNTINFIALAAAMVMVVLLLSELPASAIVTQSWISGMPGPGHSFDEMHGVATDAGGNVYIAGDFFNHTSADFITLKYNPAGIVSWYSAFNSQGQNGDHPEAMVADAAGNVYITGRSNIPGHSVDVATVKYNTWGQQLWAAYYNSPNNDDDLPTALVLDEDGNVYVTGYTGSNNPDYLTIKYNANGVQQWAATFNGTGNGYDKAGDVAVDRQGNVYITGRSQLAQGTDIACECATIKYNSVGVQQWVGWHHDPSKDFYEPSYVALDSHGNVYAASASVYDNQADYLTIKFDASGQEVWVRSYDGPQHQGDYPCGLAIDSQDNVIVTGTSTTPGAWGSQYVTIKYDSAGNQLWLRGYRGDVVESNTGNQALALDADGNIYLTGTSAYYSFYPDCGTLNYDPQGNLKWIAISDYNDSNSGGQYLTLDAEGNVLVSGWFGYIGQNASFLTIKLHQIPGDVYTTMTPSVTPVVIPAQGGSFSYELLSVNAVRDNLVVDYWWKVIYPTSQNSQVVYGPIQAVLPLDSTIIQRIQRIPGNAPAGTYSYILNSGDYPGMIWATDTLLFTKLTTGNGPLVDGWDNFGNVFTAEAREICASIISLHPCSPNPFNPTTSISYELRAASYVSLKVYDTTGRRVANLVDGWREAGMHEVTFDGSKLASGLYFVRMQVGNHSSVQKMMLVK